MKFAAVVVLLALAFGIEASIIPLAPAHGPSLTVSGPALVAAAPAWGHAAWAPATSWAAHSPWAAPAIAVAPAAIATHAAIAPAAIATHAAIAPAAPWGHEGSYVAKTRGAVHVAPLAGHAHSAASINLQPAPGTI
ncbi:adult cuticle protein 1-like [Hermetia illucens]|uniref:adult cuticle protein 1-like n=1 Tax=Hermetia illucens TaxID=343691 RepID=UPI0018CC457F|nr:adult cuticle protein 1-like [Hermetia illucens]